MTQLARYVDINDIVIVETGKIREFHPDSEQYHNLQRSMANMGFDPHCPVLLRPHKDAHGNIISNKWELVNGRHRTEAARSLGITDIPAVVRDNMTDQEAAIAQYQFNESVPTTLKEKSNYFKRFCADHDNLTQSQIADMHGITPTYLGQLLRYDNLTPEATKLVESGKIKATAALHLATIPQEFQNQFLDAAQNKPTNEFCDLVVANRKTMKEAQKSGKTEVAVQEFPPRLMSKDAVVTMLQNAEQALNNTDAEDEKYATIAERVRTLKQVLQIDPEFVAQQQRIKQLDKDRKALERLAKEKEEREARIKEIEARNAAANADMAEVGLS